MQAPTLSRCIDLLIPIYNPPSVGPDGAGTHNKRITSLSSPIYAYVTDTSMRAINSSKLRDMMSSFIDTIIHVHQDSRGAVVADEDLLDVLLRTQREDELLDRPSPART
jgi:hypothetical protein